MTKAKKILICVAVVVGSLIVLGLAGYYALPRFLIVRDEPAKADAMIVLNLATARLDYGVSLYKKGLANKVIVIPGQGLKRAIIRILGVELNIFDVYQMVIEYLVRSGVDREAIVYEGTLVQSTYEEAMVAKKVCDANGFRSLLVVTSGFHSRRTMYAFRKVFGDRVVIKSLPVPLENEDFCLDGWIFREKEVLYVINETIKYVFYILKY